MLQSILLIFLTAFVFGLIFAPIVYKLSKKFKASQTILKYVEEHKSKQGTPTMGGIIFILACFIACLVFLKKDSTLALIAIVVMLSYGILGFLDDFIKIKFHQNQGLRAYQKIIGQVGIAFFIALFCYKSNLVGSEVVIPFTDITFDLGFFIIPFIMFVYLALVNSVNLIDGLDGLAGGVSFFCLIAFGILIVLSANFNNGQSYFIEQQNLSLICFAMAGAILPFLILNVYPAKIFMGDTGSLALGGLITSVAVFSRLEFFILIFGISYVVTAVSDIIQVVYFKLTKKRVFLMAPLHHHFQKKGMNENKIVFVYILVTAIISVIAIMLTI